MADLVARGLCDREIGRALGLSEKTAGSYLKIIYERYHVHTRAALSAVNARLPPAVSSPGWSARVREPVARPRCAGQQRNNLGPPGAGESSGARNRRKNGETT